MCHIFVLFIFFVCSVFNNLSMQSWYSAPRPLTVGPSKNPAQTPRPFDSVPDDILKHIIIDGTGNFKSLQDSVQALRALQKTDKRFARLIGELTEPLAQELVARYMTYYPDELALDYDSSDDDGSKPQEELEYYELPAIEKTFGCLDGTQIPPITIAHALIGTDKSQEHIVDFQQSLANDDKEYRFDKFLYQVQKSNPHKITMCDKILWQIFFAASIKNKAFVSNSIVHPTSERATCFMTAAIMHRWCKPLEWLLNNGFALDQEKIVFPPLYGYAQVAEIVKKFYPDIELQQKIPTVKNLETVEQIKSAVRSNSFEELQAAAGKNQHPLNQLSDEEIKECVKAAYKNDNYEIIQFFLQHGFDIDTHINDSWHNTTLFSLAVRDKKKDLVLILLEKYPKLERMDGNSILQTAIYYGSPEIACLVANHYMRNGFSMGDIVHDIAGRKNAIDILTAITENNGYRLTLNNMIEVFSRHNITEALLNAFCDRFTLDPKSEEAEKLLFATESIEGLKKLIKLGVPLDKKIKRTINNSYSYSTIRFSGNFLHFILRRGQGQCTNNLLNEKDLVPLLINNNYGHMLNERDYEKQLPLHLFIHHFSITGTWIPLFKKICKQTSDINARDKNGSTPLHAAFSNKGKRQDELNGIIRIILKQNPNLKIFDSNGNPLMHHAIAHLPYTEKQSYPFTTQKAKKEYYHCTKQLQTLFDHDPSQKNYRNSKGQIPLVYAASEYAKKDIRDSDSSELVHEPLAHAMIMLIDVAQSNVHAKDNNGMTALDYILQANPKIESRVKFVAILTNLGARASNEQIRVEKNSHVRQVLINGCKQDDPNWELPDKQSLTIQLFGKTPSDNTPQELITPISEKLDKKEKSKQIAKPTPWYHLFQNNSLFKWTSISTISGGVLVGALKLWERWRQ